MIILFWELCSCQNLRSLREKYIGTKTIVKTWYQKTCCQRSVIYRPSKNCCKRCGIIFGRILLFGFLFLLFLGNFIMRLLTIGHITGSISLTPLGFQTTLYLRHHVSADRHGPGLDGKRDGAMFIYMHMTLPQHYQVVLLNKKSVKTRRSILTNQIINRIHVSLKNLAT